MKNIFVPIDFSGSYRNILKYAISLGLQSNSRFVFYHAGTRITEDTRKQANKMIQDVFSELKGDPEKNLFEVILEEEIFSNEGIIAQAKKHNADLVIMGSSTDGMKHTFYGSHLSGFIDEINIPVIAVPHDYHEIAIDRIGYATELEDLSVKIREIIPFAKRTGASIEAFYVYPVFPTETDLDKFDVKNVLYLLKKENEYEKIDIHFVKTNHDNELVEGIHEFIRTYKPDLLVMCHKPRGWFDKLILFDSGVTPAVAGDCPIPVLALNRCSACRLL